MKKVLCFLALAFSTNAFSQSVGISDVNFTPNSKAVLDLSSDRKGLLVPRIDLLDVHSPITNSPAKPEGLIIYNTAATSTNFPKAGFYFWDGSAWQTIATDNGTVSGTGTQNYLPKWNNAAGDALGNSQIFDDGSSVGIATSTPASVLTVYDPDESATLTNFTQAVNQSGALVSTEYFANSYTPGLFWNTVNDNPTKPKAGIFMYQQTTGSSLMLGTSNNYTTGITNTALTINRDGNIGINSTTPGAKLALEGNARVQDEIRFQNNTDYKGLVWGNTSWGDTYSRIDDYGGNLYLMTDDGFNITDINTTTGAPGTNWFQMVNGAVTISNLGGSGTKMLQTDNNGLLSASSFDPSVVHTGSGTTNYAARWTGTYSLGTGVIQDNGTDVGIGVAPGTFKLNVNGTAQASTYYTSLGSGNIYEVGDDAWLTDINTVNSIGITGQQTSSHGGLRLGTNTTAYLYSNGTANIGIGTTAPTGKLHVHNSDGSRAIFGSTGNLSIYDSETYTGEVRIGAAWNRPGVYSSNQLELFSDNTGIIFGDSDVERMRLTAAGNLGIGSTSPMQTLDVNGRVNVTNGVIQRGGAAVTGTSDLGLYSRVSGNWIRIVSNAAPINFFSDDNTGTSVNVSIQSDGDLEARKGLSTQKNYKYYTHYITSGTADQSLGNYDLCALAGFYLNVYDGWDDDGKQMCEVYPYPEVTDYTSESSTRNITWTDEYNAKPAWWMYMRCQEDNADATRCSAVCVNFD